MSTVASKVSIVSLGEYSEYSDSECLYNQSLLKEYSEYSRSHHIRIAYIHKYICDCSYNQLSSLALVVL